MKDEILKVSANLPLNETAFELTFDDAPYIAPGQFVELAVDGVTLRRPFSVFDYTDEKLTIIYKVVGKGTDIMSRWKVGDEVNALMPLGNGFNLDKATKPLLVGGGVGGAPLRYLAKEFAQRGVRPIALLAARTKNEIEGLAATFSEYADVICATDDGTLGEKGNAVEVLKRLKPDYDFYYACGPSVMMKYLARYDSNGELCLEARMGCGFGACMGCSVLTVNGAKRVCKDGPVFEASEVIFDD